MLRQLKTKLLNSKALTTLQLKFPRVYSWIEARLRVKEFTGMPLTLITLVFIGNLLLLIEVTEHVIKPGITFSADIATAKLIGSLRTPVMLKIFNWYTQIGFAYFVTPLTILILPARGRVMEPSSFTR